MNAVGYTRYSTDRQSENSTAYQINAITQYCKKNNINLLRFYSDEEFSGTNTDRPAFQELIHAAKHKLFDAVIVYDISRGSRDVSDWFHFRKEMGRLNISVISATQSLGDFDDPNSFLVELITAGLGQHQVLDTRKKSRAGVAEKAKQGVFLGGYAPIGYDIINQMYVINNAEAQIVRTIFSLYADGKSYEAILSALNGAKGKRGRTIGKNSINSILKNERYIGVYTWNKRKYKVMRKWAGGALNPDVVRIENIIPAIIDMDTWERVQSRMKDNKRKATNKAKYEYLLTGLIECESCGATYVGHTSTNSRGIKNRYYVCGNKYRTHECKSKSINADKIEEFVIMSVQNYLNTANFDELADQIIASVNSASTDLAAEKRELNEVTAKINNGIKAILNGMEIPELKDEIDSLRVRKSELEDIIARNSKYTKSINKEKLVRLLQGTYENFEWNVKEAIKTHVTKIYAHVDGSFTVNIGVHIDYCGGRKHIVCTTYKLVA